MSSDAFQLSEQQKTFFQTFGYLGFPGLVADKAEAISQAFEDLWSSHGGGHGGQQHDGSARSCIVRFVDQSPYLSTLLDDPRVLGIATSLLGDDFNYMGSDGNYYVGDTRWHSDGWHPQTLHIKIAFYLDPLTRDTGALRVIPGSHRLGEGYAEGLQKQIRQSTELWGVEGRDVPAIALETNPGDIVVFNHNTKHSAWGRNKRRRMFTMNLCQRYPEERVQELRDYISGAARFWIDRAYDEQIVQSAGPERIRHLEQVLANDGHLAELSRKARETMPEPSRG